MLRVEGLEGLIPELSNLESFFVNHSADVACLLKMR